MSGAFGTGTAGLLRTDIRNIPENFFASWSTLSAADDCCGEVSRSNRGSFLVARSNAGGNRAEGREPPRLQN
jgi:hypothetical protein